MECDTGTSQSLPDQTMRCVEVNGQKILLVRVGGVCHAVSAVCPHAGAPLEQGVLHGDMLICPWHRATFRVTNGRLIDPPVLDDLSHYPVRKVDEPILVSSSALPTTARWAASDVVDTRCTLIADGGAAGATPAQAVREEGFTGCVVMLDPEDRLPYDRTVLSKHTLSGQHGDKKLPLQHAAYAEFHHVERLARAISRIDPAARRIDFTDAPSLDDSMLLVAPDADAIAEAAVQARQAVVVGAAFIAMEAAACLRAEGLAVAVVVPEQVPFERQFGAEIGSTVQRVHERSGVTFHLDDTVVAVEGERPAQSTELQNNLHLPADLVLLGLTLREDGGVPVDACLPAADHLFTAGDIATFPPSAGDDLIRIEHWRVAQQHGRRAARNMPGAGRPNRDIPYFWTTHFQQRLDHVGHAKNWDEIVVDGDLQGLNFGAWLIEAGMGRAVAGWGQHQRMASVLAQMHDRPDWNPTELRNATQHLHA